MSQRLPAAAPTAVHDLNGPSWLRISAVTIAGLSVGAGVLVVLALALAVFGLGGIYEDAHDFVGMPVPIVDAWSLLADAGRLFAASWLLAWILRRSVRLLIPGWELRTWPVVMAIAIGWVAVPGVAMLVAAALIVVVVARVGLVRAPTPAAPRLEIALVTVLAGSLLAVATLSYQPLHPLASLPEPAFDAGEDNGVRAATITLPPGSGRARGFEFTLRNDGPARVTLRSVNAQPRSVNAHLPQPSSALFDVRSARVITDGNGYGSVGSAGAVAGMHVASGDQIVLRVRTQATACTTGQTIFVIQTVAVRFETLGLARTQRFDMDPPRSLSCQRASGS